MKMNTPNFDNPLHTRYKLFCRSLLASRIMAKIALVSTDELPINLPNQLKIAYRESLLKTRDKVSKEGLPWKKVDDRTWVANPRLEVSDEYDISNDIFDLLDLIESEDKENTLTLEDQITSQLWVSTFSHLDSFMTDVLGVILLSENRMLKCNKTITWETIINSGNYENVIEHMISNYTSEFGHLDIRTKLNFWNDRLGIDIGLSKKSLDYLYDWEQIRNLFVHTGGIVSAVYLDRVKSSPAKIGQRICVTVDTSFKLVNDVIDVGSALYHVVSKKYWSTSNVADKKE